MALDSITADLEGNSLRIGIVQARFNDWAGNALAEACLAQLRELGVDEDDITHVTVPGALEVPLALAKLARADDFDALIAIGCVIRGETYHFEIVCDNANHFLMEVAALEGVPVGNAILTVDTLEQAEARAKGGEKGKGGDAARAVLRLIEVRQAFEMAGA